MQRRLLDLLVVIGLGVLVYAVSSRMDILERIMSFATAHEAWEVDELLVMSTYFTFALLVYVFLRWREVGRAERQLGQRNRELEIALAEVRQLQGIIPICAMCKRVRDDKGYWQQVEVYVRDHSEAEFSHGYCPECAKKLFAELESSQGDTSGS